MGLDTSHNAWHGAYSAFHRWRQKIAQVAGLPPLELMEGFYDPLPPNDRHLSTLYAGIGKEYSHSLKTLDERLPIKWETLNPSPLHELLCHSDCDGEIKWKACGKIADELEKLLPLLDEEGGGHIGNFREKTETFIKGLRLAHSKKENLDFH
jgi:hypothetical protein